MDYPSCQTIPAFNRHVTLSQLTIYNVQDKKRITSDAKEIYIYNIHSVTEEKSHIFYMKMQPGKQCYDKCDTWSLWLVRCDIKWSAFSCLSDGIWHDTSFSLASLLRLRLLPLSHVRQGMWYFLAESRHKDAGNYVSTPCFTVPNDQRPD